MEAFALSFVEWSRRVYDGLFRPVSCLNTLYIRKTPRRSEGHGRSSLKSQASASRPRTECMFPAIGLIRRGEQAYGATAPQSAVRPMRLVRRLGNSLPKRLDQDKLE